MLPYLEGPTLDIQLLVGVTVFERALGFFTVGLFVVGQFAVKKTEPN